MSVLSGTEFVSRVNQCQPSAQAWAHDGGGKACRWARQGVIFANKNTNTLDDLRIAGQKTVGGWDSPQKWGAPQKGRCCDLALHRPRFFRCTLIETVTISEQMPCFPKEKAVAAIKNATIALQNGQQFGCTQQCLEILSASCSPQVWCTRQSPEGYFQRVQILTVYIQLLVRKYYVRL